MATYYSVVVGRVDVAELRFVVVAIAAVVVVEVAVEIVVASSAEVVVAYLVRNSQYM